MSAIVNPSDLARTRTAGLARAASSASAAAAAGLGAWLPPELRGRTRAARFGMRQPFAGASAAQTSEPDLHLTKTLCTTAGCAGGGCARTSCAAARPAACASARASWSAWSLTRPARRPHSRLQTAASCAPGGHPSLALGAILVAMAACYCLWQACMSSPLPLSVNFQHLRLMAISRMHSSVPAFAESACKCISVLPSLRARSATSIAAGLSQTRLAVMCSGMRCVCSYRTRWGTGL